MLLRHYLCIVFFLIILQTVCVISGKRYEPTWDSLDTRPAPGWYDDAKIGVFLHWGVFSVPAFGTSGLAAEWFWAYWGDKSKEVVNFMSQNYRPSFVYPDFASQFTAEFFKPTEWADLFEKAGIKYVVLTSKHHEGYTMWPSNVSWNWNAMDVGPKRDLVGDLASAVRNKTDIHFGLYHSLYEWYNPIYARDKNNAFRTQDYVTQKCMPELLEIVNNYKPEVIWSDGDWEAGPEYWNSTEFLAWLYNDSPVKDTVLVNDRWGKDVPCKHGDFYNCKDRYHPGVLLKHKWESAMTLDRYSWGYRRNMAATEVKSIEELISDVVSTVSCNGNILINVGPTKEGTIAPIFQERFLQLGQWLKINGEAIYKTRPWKYQNDTLNGDVWYTSKGEVIYAIALKWPQNNELVVGALKPTANSNLDIRLLGYPGKLKWVANGTQTVIKLPVLSPSSNLKWAWTLKIVTNPSVFPNFI